MLHRTNRTRTLSNVFAIASLSFLTTSLLATTAHAAASAPTCAALFQPKPAMTEAEEWQLAINSIRAVIGDIQDSEATARSILATMIAREFVWLNGDPGGAKTLISRKLFQAALRSIPENDKRIFVLQFHKLLNEGVITGFKKIKSLLDRGALEYDVSTSLVGEQFLFLIADEAEKANPATLNALLSVLNERKAMLGSKVVNAILSSGVFTSNKTMGAFIEGAGNDRPSYEALADRMVIKIHVPNQASTIAGLSSLYRNVEASRTGSGSTVEIVIPLKTLQKMFKQVKIEPDVFIDIAEVAMSFDALVTEKADGIETQRRGGPSYTEAQDQAGTDIQPYFPANQFSNRSMVKAPAMLKAAFIVDQLMLGRPLSQLRLNVTRRDLHLLAPNYAYGSISRVRPKRVVLTGIQGTEGYIPELNLQGEWDPYNNLLYVSNPLSGSAAVLSADRRTQTLTPMGSMTAEGDDALTIETTGLFARLLEAEQAAQVNLDLVEYELDGALGRLLSRKTLPKLTKDELDSIKKDQEELTGLLNTQSSRPSRPVSVSSARQDRLRELSRQARQSKVKLRENRRSPEVTQAIYFESNRAAFEELTLKFPETAHYIKAIMVALASSNHVYAFGPPGGAKTMIARLILDSEVKYVNKQEWIAFTRKFLSSMTTRNPAALSELLKAMRNRDPRGFKRFFLQFHKLLPEGVISGTPKLQAQIESGRLEYNFDDSLASRKFMVAILDEVDKANPAVLTTLLSVLNEREVFAGATVYKAGLISAVLTSNKMLSELLDSFGDDRPTGEALADRAIDKVYVANKFTDVFRLAQLLYDIENGMAPVLENPLNLSGIRARAKDVKVPDEVLMTLAKVHDQYMQARIDHKERSESVHKGDPVAYPDYYIPASSPSNRTFVALVDQLKARILVEQMLAGVPYNQLRMTAQIDDIAYFFEGLGYWGPFEIKTEYAANGLIRIVADKTGLSALLNSSNVNRRQKEQLTGIEGEVDDFVTASNDVIQTFVLEFRDSIARYPHLFPTLFGSEEARRAWVAAHANRGAQP